MRIGIMTWFFADNYGARAQCFALQQMIKQMNIDVEVINYVPPKGKLRNLKMCFSHPGFKMNPFYLLRDYLRHCKFKKDLKIYCLSPRVHNANEINHLELDGIIYGSDAIFNLYHPMSNQLYFGVGVQCNKMTYSPSCEYMNTDDTFPEKIIDSLLTMIPISVRDENTAQLLRNNKITDVKITLDPTFLYDFHEYHDRSFKEDYILVYTFSDWYEYAKSFRQFAEDNRLKIVSVGRYCSWADKNYDMADLGEWISSFFYATYIITDSYHGLIFAIKNNKEFIILNRKDKIDKIYSLLRQLSIERTIYEKRMSVINYLSQPINYNQVNRIICELRSNSIEYIKRKINMLGKA